MSDAEEILNAIWEADRAYQTGFVRYLCELALRHNPEDAFTLIRYSDKLVALGLYQHASDALDRAEAATGEDLRPFILAQRGHLLKEQGRFTAAEEMYLAAHRLKPDEARYLIYAGAAAHRNGDIDRAMDFARRAIECPEGCVDEAYFNLGGCYLARRQYQEAANCYRKALEIEPDYPIAAERLKDVELILGHIHSNSP